MHSFLVTAPTNVRALVRIKTRVRLGNMQLDAIGGLLPGSAGTAGRSAWKKLLASPSTWPAIVLFVVVRAVVEARARWLFRRGHLAGWARDESSRWASCVRPGNALPGQAGDGPAKPQKAGYRV